MKRVLSALILVLVLVPLMLLMRWGGEAKGPWSAARDGVQARLVAPRFLWREGEDVALSVRLRNRSGDARDVRALSLHLVVRREGRLVAERDVTLAPATLRAGAAVDVPALTGPLDDQGPGLRTVEASLDGLGLPPIKLRVVKPRSAQR